MKSKSCSKRHGLSHEGVQMKIAVIGTMSVAFFPPGINLVSALLDLGVDVTLVAHSIDEVPKSLSLNPAFSSVELGVRKSRKEKFLRSVDSPRIIRHFLNEKKHEFDAIWTLTDYAARACGKTLLNCTHIMSLAELVEYTPAFFRRRMPFHSRTTVELARNAARVVVPEYNRAHIQKTWWDLPRVPAVLPNKPYPDYRLNSPKLGNKLKSILEAEPRKIILYQGVYAKDRDLSQYAEAVELLGDEYALYLMGRATTGLESEIASMCASHSNVHDLGFLPAPNHLAVTPYGHIGLLPYVPRRCGANSVLNPLYCAPNKIWEYSGFGLPMVGSDVPGIMLPFQQYGMGEVSDGTPQAICEAILRIESEYSSYSNHAQSFYDSVDIKSSVAKILDEAGIA